MENKTNSTGHKVMDEIIDAIKPDLDKVINAYKKEAIKDGKGFTKRDEEYVELLYTFKLAQSIGNYVKPDDSIENIKFSLSPKGYTISAKINRDGMLHDLITEAILAGGYNIQTLHYRYITDTTLPSVNNTLVDPINEKIKKLKKEDKIKSEIERLSKVKDDLEAEVKELSSLTKTDFVKNWEKKQLDNNFTLDWDLLSEEAKNINYNNNKENFYNNVEKWKEEDWKRHLKWLDIKQNNLKTVQKDIDRNKKKLEQC